MFSAKVTLKFQDSMTGVTGGLPLKSGAGCGKRLQSYSKAVVPVSAVSLVRIKRFPCTSWQTTDCDTDNCVRTDTEVSSVNTISPQERRLFDDSFAVNEVPLSRGVFQGLEIMRFITEDAALAVS